MREFCLASLGIFLLPIFFPKCVVALWVFLALVLLDGHTVLQGLP